MPKPNIRIYINGVKWLVNPGLLTYQDLISLAKKEHCKYSRITYSVNHAHGHSSGSMSPLGSVIVVPDMVFHVGLA